MCPLQECVPEDLKLKKEIFARLDGLVGDDVVLSSSTSCLLPSRLFTGLAHVQQCIVAHPVSTWPAGLGAPPAVRRQHVSVHPLEYFHCFVEM